jgi:hypothetical protein
MPKAAPDVAFSDTFARMWDKMRKKTPVFLATAARACYTKEKRRAARFFKTYKLNSSNWQVKTGAANRIKNRWGGMQDEVFRDTHGDVGLVFRLVPGAAAHGVRL